MTDPLAAPPAPPTSSQSNRALISLILGIVGLLCCGFLAPVACYMGHQELKNIRAGVGDPSKQGLATAGWILGIIGTILLIFSLMWIFFFGGMAILSTLGGFGS